MQWISVTVDTTTEAVEAVSNLLMETGAEGVKIDDAADFAHETISNTGVWLNPDSFKHQENGAQVTAYFSEQVNVPELLPELTHRVHQLSEFGLDPGAGTVKMAAVDEKDWANTWKKYYHPVRLSRYLTIVPSWEDYQVEQQNEQVIRLDPGQAFGTGTHPTTQLMLGALETLMRGGEEVIDVGTGSRVLAIAAELLGAEHILATDVDQVAVDNAQSNLALNPVTHIDVIANDLLTGIEAQADLVLANILAEVLLPLIPQVPAVLKPKGQLVLSGIYYDKADVIKQALIDNGLAVTQMRTLGDWVAYVAQRPGADES